MRLLLLTACLGFADVAVAQTVASEPTPAVIETAIDAGYSKSRERYNFDILLPHCAGPCVFTPYMRAALAARSARDEMRPRPSVADMSPDVLARTVTISASPLTSQRCTPTGLLLAPARGSREQKAAVAEHLDVSSEPRRYTNALGGTWESVSLRAVVPLEKIARGMSAIATYDNCEPDQTTFPTSTKAPW